MKSCIKKVFILMILLLSVFIFCVFPASATEAEISKNEDYIRIISVTPDYYENYTDEVTFTAVIEYNLTSCDQGIVYLGFNTEEAHWHNIKNEIQVQKGNGTIELSASVIPVDWSSSVNMALQGVQMLMNGYNSFVTDFLLYANISEYPHEDHWIPLATEEFVLHYGKPETEQINSEARSETKAAVSVGEYINMGTYFGEPITWRCVSIDENGALMLSDKILCLKAFDASTSSNLQSGSHSRDSEGKRATQGSTYWPDSTLRSWLNSNAKEGCVEWLCGNSPSAEYVDFNPYDQEAGFLTVFSNAEMSCIKDVTHNVVVNHQESNVGLYDSGSTQIECNMEISNVMANYDSAYAVQVTDKIFLLDLKQLNSVYANVNILGNSYYMATPTQACVDNCEWDKPLSIAENWFYWLLTPTDKLIKQGSQVSTDQELVRTVYISQVVNGVTYGNNILYNQPRNCMGVRPAFYLKEDANFVGEGTATSPFTIGSKNVSVYCGDSEYLYQNELEYYLFNTSTVNYSPELASMLMGLSYAAYNKEEIEKSIESVLGIDKKQYMTYNYYDNPNDKDYGNNSVAFSIAQKESDGGNTIVLITVRGSYGEAVDWTKDWISNINIGNASVWYSKHGGFETAAQEVYDELIKYVGEIKTDGVKYVITGHSRGAAVANILELMLSDQGVPKENVYGYNFACPDVAVATPIDWNRFSTHDNMFNIANATDPVSVIPGMLGSLTPGGVVGDWGKFGRSFWFSEDWNNLSKCQVVLTNFDSHGQDKYFALLRSFMEQGIELSDFKSWQDTKLKCAELAARDALSSMTSVIFCVFCPVDVEVLDSNGKSVLSIVNNDIVVDLDCTDEVFASIYDGDKKIIILTEPEEYRVRMTATDDGEMTFGVCLADMINYNRMDEINYSDIKLENGKTMEYPLIVNQDKIYEPHLYVLNDEGEKVAEIDTDGTENIVVNTSASNSSDNIQESKMDQDYSTYPADETENNTIWTDLFLFVYFTSVVMVITLAFGFCRWNSHNRKNK